MKILFINNNGGGFADNLEIPNGTTVGALFTQQVHNESPANYLIRVNRQASTAEQVLNEGDRVTVTPVKIEGANS